jgi:hypothetical protein
MYQQRKTPKNLKYNIILYKLCVFYVDRNSKMITTAGHSFYIGPIGSFYNQVNDTGSWEPLVDHKFTIMWNYLINYINLNVQKMHSLFVW